MAEPGQVLDGRYRLDAHIAAGGMGEVWRGTDLALNRAVAVKLLRAEQASDADGLARFRAEAQHTGSLSHPNIARVYDYCEPAPPDPAYLVLELVEGPSLARLLDSGPISPDRTLDVIEQAASGLAAAHRSGLLHRDIKPGNLLLTQDGLIKITDFGIARMAGSVSQTRTGALTGTPAYLAPERFGGAPATPAADLYALGVVAHHCLTGQVPFAGEPLVVALAHVERDMPRLPAWVPASLAALVADLTRKDPYTRPASAAAVLARAGLVRAAISGLAAGPTRISAAGTSAAGTSATGTSDPGTSPIETSLIGTSPAEISSAGISPAGDSLLGTRPIGTSPAGSGPGGTNPAETSSVETSAFEAGPIGASASGADSTGTSSDGTTSLGTTAAAGPAAGTTAAQHGAAEGAALPGSASPGRAPRWGTTRRAVLVRAPRWGTTRRAVLVVAGLAAAGLASVIIWLLTGGLGTGPAGPGAPSRAPAAQQASPRHPHAATARPGTADRRGGIAAAAHARTGRRRGHHGAGTGHSQPSPTVTPSAPAGTPTPTGSPASPTASPPAPTPSASVSSSSSASTPSAGLALDSRAGR